MANLSIQEIPMGSQLVSTIGTNDTPDKNDFEILILSDENVTGLTESSITLSSGATLVSLTGKHAVWQAVVRPPQTSGIVTVTVAENAVAEGNAETTKDIRVTRFFPDADAETPTLLFNHNLSYAFRSGEGTNGRGIACTPSRIILSSSGRVGSRPPFTNYNGYIDFFRYDGTHQSSELIASVSERSGTSGRLLLGRIDFLNNDLIYSRKGRLNLQTHEFSVDLIIIPTYAITHTRFGIARSITASSLSVQPYDFDAAAVTLNFSFDFTNQLRGITAAAHQNDLIYIYDNSPSKSDTFPGVSFLSLHITEEETLEVVASLNIARASSNSTWRDMAIFRDTLYLLDSMGVYTLDIRKYRPMAQNTKTTIYPIFAEAGDILDLKQFSPDAERIVFDVGFDKPSYLSINANNELVVGSGAQTCLVKLKAMNRIDATETERFQFYLIVRQTTAPLWREVSELTMRAGSSYDLFQLVDAASIEFRRGRTQLAGSRVSNGFFTVGTVGGVAEFTAQKGGLSSHIAITIDVVQAIGSDSTEVSGYRIEIAGIDVTSDSVAFPSVSETLDPVVINESRVNEASLTLRNEDGKYNSDIADNFWQTHGLNTGGFQSAVKIYLTSPDESESLHFSGVINESFLSIQEATFKISCLDVSSRLRKALVEGFGTFEKWDALRKQSDEESYQGIYVPEGSLVPMQVGTGIARSDRTDLDIRRLELPSEGPTAAYTGYMTATEFRTAGGFLSENPLLRFKAQHLSEDVRFLINQLAVNKGVYNTEIDIPGVQVEDPFVLNRGSVAFSVEQMRITRLPADWVHDSSNNRILILLSNPEAHLADVLVQYDMRSDSYRVLHTFEKDLAVHRIERRSETDYYVLTSAKIPQDRSARQLPRQNDATSYAYDSLVEGSAIKIYQYSTSTGNLAEHVAEDDEYPPQVGMHYHVGFENDLYVDTYEGIRPDYRGAFKWQSGNLYYRYAKDGEFGVAQVETDGTTTQLISEARLIDNNHLNFAFDVTDTGDVYMACNCSVSVPSVTVVASTPIKDTISIADDLSSYPIPLELEINLVDVQIQTNAGITISGTDANGDPVDEHIRVQGEGTYTLTVDPRFSTVTSVTHFNLIEGSLSITTVVTPFPGFVVKRRTSDGTDSTPLMDTRTFETLTDLDAAGGVHLGVHECVFHDNHLYILAQIGRVDVDDSERIIRSRQKAAGRVLYRCDVTAASPSLTVLDRWDFVHQAGCNLTLHDGNVHYVENPSAATVFKPYNPDLEGYWTDAERTQTIGYNVVPESLGALKKITNSGEVEHLGNVWYTDRPYNVFPTRMLSFNGELHLTAGYGNLDELLRFNSLASGAENVVHLVYGRTLHYVLPRFGAPSGSVYAGLADIAKKVNATLSFEKNVILLSDRRPYRAVTDDATGTGTENLRFSDANKVFPSSGYLLIGKEILKYTGITDGAFTGIQRGILGSPIADHAEDSRILYLDTLIQTEELGSPYKAITLQSDTNRIFNVIRDSGGIAEVRDEASIAQYGERPYTLDLGLTRHEKAWSEAIFQSYLEELKDLQQIVNIQVVPDYSLRLGQMVPFFYKGLISGMRIVSVRYEQQTTHLKGRTVTL